MTAIPVTGRAARMLTPAAALLLQQVTYWAEKMADHRPGGWFYKPAVEWQVETGLSRTRFETARRKLKALGVIETKRIGYNPVLFWRVDLAAVARLFDSDNDADNPAMGNAGTLQWAMREPCNAFHKTTIRIPNLESCRSASRPTDGPRQKQPTASKQKALELVEVHRSWIATDSASETVAVPVKVLHDLADAYRGRWPKQAHASWTRLQFVQALRSGFTRQEFEQAFDAALDELAERATGDDDRWIANLGHWLETRLADAVEHVRHVRSLVATNTGDAAQERGEVQWHGDVPDGNIVPTASDISLTRKTRLADEYDAAQARGEVAAHGGGRNFNVPNGNVEPTAADIGLTRRAIHEARHIRDAEMRDPLGAFVDEGDLTAATPAPQPCEREPARPAPSPPGVRSMTWPEHLALMDAEAAERAARRAERRAARGQPTYAPGTWS